MPYAWPRLAFEDPGETRPEVRRAYNSLVWDGIFAQAMTALTTGAFFTSYVLALGASNTLVGLLSAAAPLAQVLQWPSVPWVVRAQSWRAVSVATASIGRTAWFIAAFLPWFAPQAWRLPLLLGIISVHYVTNGITCCAFNAWMRAIVPARAAGRFFGHRTAWATAAGVAAGTLGGFAVDRAEGSGHALVAYSASIALGALLGWIGLWFLHSTPDASVKAMTLGHGAFQGDLPAGPAPDNRNLYVFLGAWAFALYLMQPFVTVYLLQYLHLGVGWTMGLTMAGQALNVALFPVWGRLADRYTNRAVLRVSCTVGALAFLLWPVAAHLSDVRAQILVAVVAMLGGGAAQSGALLCCYLLNLKSAPSASATAAIAKGNGISGLAALAASALGGWLADTLDASGLRELSGCHGLDAVFALAAVIGGSAAAWLSRVNEEGNGRGRDVLRALFRGIV